MAWTKISKTSVAAGKALRAAGVAIRRATVEAAEVLRQASQRVTAATVTAVRGSLPLIRGALNALAREGLRAAFWGTVFQWVSGECASPVCRRGTSDGPFGDVFCCSCAGTLGEWVGARP